MRIQDLLNNDTGTAATGVSAARHPTAFPPQHPTSSQPVREYLQPVHPAHDFSPRSSFVSPRSNQCLPSPSMSPLHEATFDFGRAVGVRMPLGQGVLDVHFDFDWRGRRNGDPRDHRDGFQGLLVLPYRGGYQKALIEEKQFSSAPFSQKTSSHLHPMQAQPYPAPEPPRTVVRRNTRHSIPDCMELPTALPPLLRNHASASPTSSDTRRKYAG
ncbi:hypothetical protein HDU85_005540 [Gaertneriomyces sp. JEL0708]|nr:hypothetical protein HDU85_005540 [Gaertneriomyces sp. JEL0708]